MYIRFRIYDTYSVYDEYKLTENNIQKQQIELGKEWKGK